jgi:hypothetical protein
LHGDEYNFTKEDKQEVLRTFLDKQFVKCLLPKFGRDVKETKCKLALLKSLKAAYMQLKVHKSKENLSFIYALLTVVVSNNSGGPSQHFISKIINGTKYLMGKAVMRKIHVDLTRKNIWGGFPWKTWSIDPTVLGNNLHYFTNTEGCEAVTYKSEYL